MAIATTTDRIPELDGLRGIAILLVLLYHYFATAPLPRFVSDFAGLSWSGVDLFFVLSGFLLGGILLEARSSPNYFKTFYARRAYRILPAYAAICVAFVIGYLLASGTQGNEALSWLFARPLPWGTYATLTQNFSMSYYGTLGPAWLGATWSLAVEEQFYLILPFVIRYVREERLPYVLAALIVAAPVTRALLTFFWAPADVAVLTLMPCRADALMLGVAAAYLLRKERAKQFLTTKRFWLYGALVVLSLGMAWMALGKGAQAVTADSSLLAAATANQNETPAEFGGRSSLRLALSSLNYTWIALFYLCLLLISVTQRNGVFSRLLRFRLLMKLGVIAYGTYLLHQGILGLCFAVFNGRRPKISSFPDFGITMLALTLTLVLATVSWLYFEKTLVRRGHKQRYGLTNEAAAVPADVKVKTFVAADE